VGFTITGLGAEFISSGGMEGSTLLGVGEAPELKANPEGIWSISLENSKMSADTEPQLEPVTEGYTHAVQYCCHYG